MDKKDSSFFDETMGPFDGADVGELVGPFFLYRLTQKYNKNTISLYHDDDLANLISIKDPKSEKALKDFQKLFKENVLDIVIQCNLKIVNYLDVTFNQLNSTYRRYQKENNQITYINTEY